MTRAAWIAAGVAGTVSLALHGAGIWMTPRPSVATLTGGPAQLAMIGNSFEDATAGFAAVPHPPVSAQVPEVVQRADPSPISALPLPVAEPLDTQQEATAAAPVTPPTTGTEATPPAPVPPPMATAATSPTTSAPSALAAPLTEALAAAPTPVTAAVAAAPAVAEARQALAPDTQITARAGPVAQTPTADTPRPQQRISRPPPRSEPQQQQQPPQATRPPSTAGNATTDSRAGSTDGTSQGNATRSLAPGAGGESGTNGREVARYPQRVNRHLGRLRRPNVRFEGAALVAFTIADNGGLSRVSIARSSGNAEFDQLAVAHVQAGVPFPVPPAGAQRSFSVTVRGR